MTRLLVPFTVSDDLDEAPGHVEQARVGRRAELIFLSRPRGNGEESPGSGSCAHVPPALTHVRAAQIVAAQHLGQIDRPEEVFRVRSPKVQVRRASRRLPDVLLVTPCSSLGVG